MPRPRPSRLWHRGLLCWGCLLVLGEGQPRSDIRLSLHLLGVDDSSKFLEDVTGSCDVDTVQTANAHQLHPILQDLVNTTFFRLFRVNLKHPSCPFWPSPEKEKKAGQDSEKDSGTCTGRVPTIGGGKFGGKASPILGKKLGGMSGLKPSEPACSVDTEEETGNGKKDKAPTSLQDENDKLDRSMTMAEQVASRGRDNDTASCEFEEDLPSYWVDICQRDTAEFFQLGGCKPHQEPGKKHWIQRFAHLGGDVQGELFRSWQRSSTRTLRL